jgi:hypothetical protein
MQISIEASFVECSHGIDEELIISISRPLMPVTTWYLAGGRAN